MILPEKEFVSYPIFNIFVAMIESAMILQLSESLIATDYRIALILLFCVICVISLICDSDIILSPPQSLSLLPLALS